MSTPDTAGFFCITDRTPRATVEHLRAACDARDVPFYELNVAEVRPHSIEPLPVGAMLYRPAVSHRSARLEEALWQPGVASHYISDRGPVMRVVDQVAAFRQAGLPIPRTCVVTRCRDDDAERIAEAVDGVPVIVRHGGGSGGTGIVRADSVASLRSMLDLACSRSEVVEVVEYLPDATPWRAAVVGDRVVGWRRGVVPEGDFRSVAPPLGEGVVVGRGATLESIAVRAAHAAGARAAGVDMLESDDGTVVVLEANFPFYFGHLQDAGVDVAGALVDELLSNVPN